MHLIVYKNKTVTKARNLTEATFDKIGDTIEDILSFENGMDFDKKIFYENENGRFMVLEEQNEPCWDFEGCSYGCESESDIEVEGEWKNGSWYCTACNRPV